jgi:hypothetical protein
MNHLTRSNSSENLHVYPAIKSENISLTDRKLPELGDSVCSAHCMNRSTATTERTTYCDYNSNFHNTNSAVEKQPVTTVPGGGNKNYTVSNINSNSRVGRLKSLVSLSPRVSRGMRGPELQTTNGVETDGGVVVDSKGDAPSSAPFRSFTHPSSSGRGTAGQSDAEVEETSSTREKCNMKEINKARQRKTGAIAGGFSYTTGAEPEVADTTAQTSAVFRFPCVEKLIHKYTVMIAEQKERAMAEKQVENKIRAKQKQGSIYDQSSHQCQELSSNSTKRKSIQPQQKHKHELATQSAEHVQERPPTRQVTSASSDLCGCSGVSEHLCHCKYVIDSVGDPTQQIDDHEGPTEYLTKRLQPYRNVRVENSAEQMQQKEFSNITKLYKGMDFLEHPIQCECHSEHSIIHVKCSHSCVAKYPEKREDQSRESTGHFEQCCVHNRPIGHNMKKHSQQVIKKGAENIAQSQHWNNASGEESNQLRQVCQENNKEETNVMESLTSPFIKPSIDVTPYISHVGGTAISAIGDEGRHKLMLPRASKRSVSPASDEGCSVVSPPECSLTPCSSEGDIARSLAGKSTARWTWPSVSNDQDSELKSQVNRHECGRCVSSDSAVYLLTSDDERRLQMKDPRVFLREEGTESKSLDFVTSEDPSCDEAMVFDPHMNKESGVLFDSNNLQYIWRYGLSSKESRRDSVIFPDSVSRQNSVDLSIHHGDSWFEEMRNSTKEAVFDDVCDSGIDRDTFIANTGDTYWDTNSAEVKTSVSSLEDDRHRVSSPNYGYSCRSRPRQFRKLTSVISCESGVVEDEYSSITEGGENPDDDDYLVELRRQSTQSFQTDDDESNASAQYRCWRTPSVVVSDYSDDVPCFTSVTLEELEQLKDVSYSDCTSGASSVSGSVSVSAVDTEYALRTPERKASDCSTCSTLSGDEDASCDALLQPVRTTQKVGRRVCFVKRDFRFSRRRVCRSDFLNLFTLQEPLK